MALVEGVGDEVAAAVAAMAALALLGLAWFSTRTGERAEGALPAAPPRRDPRPLPDPTRPPREQQQQQQQQQEEEEEGPGGAPFVLRLKFLNETERLARVRPGDTVGALKRLYFPGQEQLVRLIYQGQLLRDDAQTLAALHLGHHSVVHCHVAPRRPPAAAAQPAGPRTEAAAAPAALNVGSLMMPLLVLMLAALWYVQLQHRQVFTATATACLAGLTLVFSFVAFAVYRR